MEADGYPDMMDFSKPSNFFDLDFTISPGSWSGQCSPAASVFQSPNQYPQTIPNFILDEDDQLLSPTSSYSGTNMPNYVSKTIYAILVKMIIDTALFQL